MHKLFNIYRFYIAFAARANIVISVYAICQCILLYAENKTVC